MKYIKHHILTLLLSAIVVFSDESDERPDFPYEYSSKEKIMINRILAPQDDLRALFCDFNVLKERIQKKMVILEMLSFHAGTKKNIPSREVIIKKRITIRDFLNMVGLEKWGGGQPQFKLIRQNSILQSPMQGTHTKEDREAFLKAWIEPGDIVLATRII